MAKRSQRRCLQYEKDQSGCIWGFISIFDFRNGRSTRRLLSHSRSGNRRAVGVKYSKSQLLLTNSDEKCQGINDGVERETLTPDTGKTSVKELMEEEMFSENEAKNQTNGADIEPRESDSEGGGNAKKSRKRRNKSRGRSFDMNAPKNVELENSCDQVSDQKTLNNLDLEVIIEELCHQIHQKSTDLAKHHDDFDVQSNQTYSVFEEKLSDALKVFVNQKFVHEKNPTEDGKIHHSKELMEALETLSLNKEMFMKLLRDPESLLVKTIQDLGNAGLEKDQSSKSVEINSRPSEMGNRKQHNFFRRKSKSKERDPLNGNENLCPTSRIVILQPEPVAMQSERTVSQFSFTEIKRKLKHAMGKEQHRISFDGIEHRYRLERQTSGNAAENGDWSSPNRNHFYTERFARFYTKPKETKTSMRSETSEYSEQRASNICIEAKKHLSEMLSNVDEVDDISRRQSPKTLGRILSLPEFNFSPICSPGKDNLGNTQMRFSPYNNSPVPNQGTSRIMQESCERDTRQSLEIEACAIPCEELKAPESDHCVVDELNHAIATEETLSSARDETCAEGGVEIVKSNGTLSHEGSNKNEVSDASVEKSSSLLIIDGGYDGEESNMSEVSDAAENCGEEKYSQCLNLDSLEEDHSVSSPFSSPSRSSFIKKADDLESPNERPEHPSPVSVLEPLFSEDDVSPASIKTRPSDKTIHISQTHLDEGISSSVDHGICIRLSMEDEESTFEYMEAVLLGSGLNWDEFLLRWLSSEELLEPSLFDEVELFSNRSSHEQKLLFDCTNEVLKEVCERYFVFAPWSSHVKKNIRPIPRGENLISEVWEGVEWNLCLQPLPRTLDQIVGRDMSKSRKWMDIRFDCESISVKVGEAIFEELIEDIILSFPRERVDKEISYDFDIVEG